MELWNREQLKRECLPGRMLEKAVGKDSPISSKKMTMGFATYKEEYGRMEPHHHAEEVVYVVSAKDAYFRHGDDSNNLGDRISLMAGMVLHFDELEWHVFDYDTGGWLEIIFFYGQTENIRPEEIKK